MIRRRTDEDDWRIFTSVVLLISSASAVARDELDNVIMKRSAAGHDVGDLVRARDNVAALASIPDHLDQEISHD